MAAEKSDVLQGTLDLLILRTLALEPLHGFGISRRLRQITGGVFVVNPGSLFPALYKLEAEGYVSASWGESENRRRARYYRLTAAGRKHLEAEQKNWRRISLAINRVLETTA